MLGIRTGERILKKIASDKILDLAFKWLGLKALGFFYQRYMDDILVLTKSKWQLRKAVKILNQTLPSVRE